MHVRRAELEALDDRAQRHRVRAIGDLDEERGDDGEGQGELDDELRAHAGDRLHLDETVQPLDGLQNDVEADAAARQLAHGLGGREPLREDELHQLAIGDGLVRLEQAPVHGLAAHRRGVDAGAVVHDRDEDVVGLLHRGEQDRAGRGLAAGHPRLRRLDAVVHAVADHVHERLADLVDDGLVDAGLLALQDQLDVLPLLPGEVAHQPRKALEDMADGQHADVHHRFLQLGGDRRHLLHRREQLGHLPLAPQLLGQLAAQLVELRAVDDQLAHEIEQVIELDEVHADHARPGRDVLRRDGRGGQRLARGNRRGRRGERRRGRDGGERRGGRCARRESPVARRARRHLLADRGPLLPARWTRRRLPEDSLQQGPVRFEAADLGLVAACLLHRVAQRAGSREEAVEERAGQRHRSLPDPDEDVLQAVDVVLDPGEAHHAAVALEGVQRSEDPRDDVGVEPFALQGQHRVIEGLEVRAGVLEVDVEELRGDLEVGHRL